PVSFEEFLAWLDEDVWAEWVDGEIVVSMPASLGHQLIRDFLLGLLKEVVERRGLGSVVSAPFLMRLPTRPSGREPDLLFVSAEHADRLQETYVDGPADLVVEIVSPDSVERDRGEKFLEYETAGVPEYWLIDYLRREALFYQLDTEGRYRPGAVSPDGSYRSAVVPGLWLRVEWLWQRPPPLVSAVMRELEG